MRTYVYALSFMLYLAVTIPKHIIPYHAMPCHAVLQCTTPQHTHTHTHYNARSHTYKTIKKSKAQSHTCMRAHIQEVEVVKIENEAFVLGIPQKIKKGRCEKEAFVLDRPLKLKVKCENDAFARDVLQKLTTSSWQSDAWSGTYSAGPIGVWSAPSRSCLAPAVRQTFPIHLPKHLLCSKTQSMRFCRFCVSAISQERVSCEPSLKKWKSKMWKPRFCARLLSKAASRRCGIEAFVRDFPQKLQELKMWQRSFRVRPPI